MAPLMYEIEGGKPLRGTVRVSGSKNASLPILTASLLASGVTVLHDVPVLRDTRGMVKLLEHLGAVCSWEGWTLTIDSTGFDKDFVPYDLMSQMRASFYAMGPMLARHGRAKVSLPGGCAIGERPVDIHLRGFEALGVRFTQSSGYMLGKHHGLLGTRVSLGGPHGTSVGATCNVLMAAVLAEGETFIDDAAREPEVVELAEFLNRMGARIEGHGTGSIRVRGVDTLQPAEWRIQPDRIEAGTWACIALATDGDLLLENVDTSAMRPLLLALTQWGAELSEPRPGTLRVRRSGESLCPVSIVTEPFPGFPTDMQSVLCALLAITPGNSTVRETIYPDRFKHVPELNRMGAKIWRDRDTAYIEGVERLQGAATTASDLRAGAALIVAALAADGLSHVRRIYHVERGYEAFDRKLGALGAVVRRVPQTEIDPGMAEDEVLDDSELSR